MESVSKHDEFDLELPEPTAPITPHGVRDVLKWLRARWVFLFSGSYIKRSGIRNVVTINDAVLHCCRIEISGSNNTLEILPGARAWNVDFRLVGDNLHCRIGANCRIYGGNFILEDSRSRLHVGDGTTLYAPMVVAQEGGSIVIGQDCLIAYGTDLRNSDAHSILDANTQERINPARDIRIRDHVWIGANCQILKGVTVAEGAIVAARSIVTKDVSQRTLVAGSPLRVLRENVDWDARRI
ncbi:MAG TPA: acyltransferase [Opitutaceae bacterium]|nr:acyltransferase [Opitutaceae bacterium]